MTETLFNIKSQVRSELISITNFWKTQTIDYQNGGFIGEINYQNQPNFQAEKGAVLNARILWTFSAVYALTNDESDLEMAERTFNYIDNHFYDELHGGIFWSLNYDGTPKDTKNQIYAIAFVIYGLTEYYKITHKEEALRLAINLYNKIEEHSYDQEKEGYFEAFTRDWQPIDDLRLSEKDANEKKTMNTHLHIVEAYANLYLVWKNDDLKNKIRGILHIVDAYFIDKNTWHLKLFFDENWIEKPDVISYGHDIEAAWLLLWCAEVIDDTNLIKMYQKYAVEIAEVTKEGLDTDGGLWYEFNPIKNELIAEKHSWPQAELWIGMINAWQISGKNDYFEIVEKNIEFVQNHLLDKENGEWFWGIKSDYTKMKKDKAGFWKCPYHNARACLELLKRL
jgi:mannobiose 2-epimerase